MGPRNVLAVFRRRVAQVVIVMIDQKSFCSGEAGLIDLFSDDTHRQASHRSASSLSIKRPKDGTLLDGEVHVPFSLCSTVSPNSSWPNLC